ncbi:MAG: carbohydrate ABC transporter permease [Chloroflexi bacterium]|nr:carbohydrate ABC transporter permease [Chloroflexota bacterium]
MAATASAELLTLEDVRRRAKRRERIVKGFILLGLVLGAVVMIFPIYWMAATAFMPTREAIARDVSLIPRSLTLINFQDGWGKLPWGQWYANTIFIASMRTLITVTINLLGGYTFAKFQFFGRNVLFFMMVATLTMPIQVILVPRFIVVSSLGLANSPWGVIIPASAEAFGIFFVRQFMVAFPDELLEAARLDGAGELLIFRRIVLPLSRPAIAVLVIMSFSWSWNGFIWPLVVLSSQQNYTVQLGLNYMKGFYYSEWSQIMAMGLLSLLPILIVFLLYQRYFIQGIAHTGLK